MTSLSPSPTPQILGSLLASREGIYCLLLSWLSLGTLRTALVPDAELCLRLLVAGLEGVAEVGAGLECWVWWHPGPSLLWPLPWKPGLLAGGL